MTEQQRQTDNRLLEMIQRHFPSLPLDDRYTDWQKWLGFARAAYEAGATDEREACANVCDANAKHWREMYTTANPRAAELVLRGYSARKDSAAYFTCHATTPLLAAFFSRCLLKCSL